MRLLVESLPIAGGVIGAGAEINWPKPTLPGAALRVESEILELRPSLKPRPAAIMRLTAAATGSQLERNFVAVG